MSFAARALGTLLIMGLVFRYWIPLLVIGSVYLIVRYTIPAYLAGVEERRNRVAAIAARADQQHNWYVQGDPRGIYGPDGAKLMRQIRQPRQAPEHSQPASDTPQRHGPGIIQFVSKFCGKT